MANKVEFGISELHVCTYTVSDNGTVTLGTPYAQKGAVSFSPEEQSESNDFYADNVIYWRKYKTGESLEDHPEMDPDIIKQVPEMMEHPAFIMKSLTRESSLTMIGELKAKNGENVMATLELTPKASGGAEAEFSLLTTAHARAKKE